mmetsp:Transcript_2284/g.5022  ORF Transcript_2284/g.5022 Transcript_2284/m.5022 type:complete len:245 (+) Transcript_2284:433-1167(+)
METGGPDPDIRPGGSDAPPEDGSDGRAPPAKRRRRDNSRMTVPIRRSDCCSDDEGGGRPEEDGVGQIPGGDLPDETGAGDIRDLLADDAGADGKRGGLWKTLDLYWTDAAERKGAVYLYGLVRAPADEDGGPAYQSCCVEVTNNQRSLLVLPRMRLGKVAGAAERRFLFDLYGEIKRLLIPSVVPEGEGFTADLVTRPYAFGDPGVPPRASGRTENLLLDRHIIGLGWIRLYYVRQVEEGRRMS